MTLLHSCRSIFRHQQVDSFFPRLHTTRRIDSRADFENNIADRYFLPTQTAYVDDTLQSETGIGIQTFQPVISQNTIFIGNRDNIRCDAHGNHIEQRKQKLLDTDIVAKTYPTTRQMTVRICIIITFGIEYGYGLRQFIIGNMMITDDKINPPTFGISYFLDGFNPAIERNNQRETVIGRIIDTFLGNTVSLIITIGDIIIDVGIKIVQKFVHQSYGRSAVDIIIAVDKDFLFGSHRFIEACDSLIHIFQQKRIVQIR